jgi:hypothetical protein
MNPKMFPSIFGEGDKLTPLDLNKEVERLKKVNHELNMQVE